MTTRMRGFAHGALQLISMHGQLIAQLGAGCLERAGRQLDDEARAPVELADAPRLERVVQADDLERAIHIEHVNGEAHEEHVDRVTGHDQQAFAGRQAGAAQQPLQARPVVVGHLAVAHQHLAAGEIFDADDR